MPGAFTEAVQKALRLVRRHQAAQVVQFDGPTSQGGASMNTYIYEDGSMETVEFEFSGREIARYPGEPREVPPGTPYPKGPPRPANVAGLPTGIDPPPCQPWPTAEMIRQERQAQSPPPPPPQPQPQPSRRTTTA